MPEELFHRFGSQEERRAFGGSCFIELGYCKLPQSAGIKRIVSVEAVPRWEDDSLYVHGDDMDGFFAQYGRILDGAIYNSMESGPPDLFGINYYPRERLRAITEDIEREKPRDFQIILDWLKKADRYTGFYVLGV